MDHASSRGTGRAVKRSLAGLHARANILSMRRRIVAPLPILLLALLAGLGPVQAQYDRDGRYVPSPNGIPSDPNARPIPMYPGTPGEAIGTPSLPRMPTITQPSYQTPRFPDARARPSGRVTLTPKRCRDGWSAATGIAPKEFERRCKKVLADDDEG
jgi:hypothetical protein